MTGVPEAKGLRFKSGKFQGKDMNWVAQKYPAYIVWCWKNAPTKMDIPEALYHWALKSIETDKLRKLRDAAASQDFAEPSSPPTSYLGSIEQHIRATGPWAIGVPPPPGLRRGVFVGDSGGNRLTPFQAATMKVTHESGTHIEEDRFGNRRVIYPNGLRAPILGPLDGFVQMEERARQFFEETAVREEPEGEPSIFQEMLEEVEGASSFLDGIL